MRIKIFLVLLFVSSLLFAQLPTDQVAKYTFNGGTLINEADPGNGDLTGTSPTLVADRFGVANNALDTNTILRNGYTFTGITNELSVSFWLQGSAPTSGTQRILQIFDGSGEGFHVSVRNGNNLDFYFKNDGIDNIQSNSGLNIFNGDWHQITITIKQTATGYDNKFYVDGVLDVTFSNNISPGNNDDLLESNALFVISPTHHYQGNIDDIELFNRELTSLEAAYLYNQTTAPLFVDKNATGSNNGSSWTNAYTNLQDALDNSISNGEIWVASDTYYPTGFAVNSQQTSRDRTFLISKPLYIFGGFNGTETLLSERDVIANPTILSGDLNNDDTSVITTTETSRQDNVYHLVSFKGDYASSGQLNGFTLSGANANSTAFDADCATAQTQQYDKRRGGAIYVNADSAGRSIFTKINNCIIENNSAIGMAVSYSMNPCGSGSTTTDIDFENSIIRNNYSVDYANIVYGSSAYSIERYGSLVNCLVYNNTSVNNSSVLTLSAHASHLNNLDVDIINSTFTKNTGIGSVMDFSNTQNNCSLYNNIIYGNIGNSLAVGGQDPANANNIVEGGDLNGINQDPLFTDAVNDDFTLQNTSSAIDSGDNTKIPSGIPTDLLGNQRIYNATVDMGCYEYGSSLITTYTLTTSAVGNGSITPSGTTTHNENDVVSVTATADAGWSFDGWSGDSASVNSMINITMDANKTLVANFSQIQYELTIIATNGSATPDSGTLNNGVYVYNTGTNVEITPTPNTGYVFDRFEITDSNNTTTSTNNPLAIIMNDHMVVEVFFTPTFALTTNTVGQGAITPINGTTYNDGDIATLTAIPAAGWQFDGWSGDLSGTTNPAQLTMDADKSVTATFSQITYTLTTITVGQGAVTPASGTVYNDGDIATTTAIPASGWQFDGWSGDLSGTTNPTQLTMDADKSVTATFSQMCNISIPDVNFKNALLSNTTINTDGDTEISCAEAIAFTGTIDVQNGGISDLTGIETFVNITELNCQDNQLSSLNVSQNTALTYLNCYTNQISSLDVTNNVFLTYLSCSRNQLTSLDISQNTVLEILGCGDNQLTSLDISNNAVLEELHFYQNNITSMDVSSLSSLTALNAVYNSLTYLNVANGNNTNFTQFHAANNPDLTCIQVDDVAYSDVNWTDIDSQTSFSVNCNLSVEDLDVTNFSVYPNPTTNHITIESTQNIKQVSVYTVLGQEVIISNEKTIDVSRLEIGMYLVKIVLENGKFNTKKFIKR